MKKFKTVLFIILGSICILYALLLIPDTNAGTLIKASEKPFAWNKNELWQQLESDFDKARQQPVAQKDSVIRLLFAQQQKLFDKIETGNGSPADSSFSKSLDNFFSLSAFVAAQPSQRNSFISFYNKIRSNVKLQSQHWNISDKAVRNLVYQQLYGMRAAVEEVLLQTDSFAFNPAMLVKNEPSKTPFTKIFGITVHSGDLLVSRGGAEVSALISRGNDYPGNFSHVALIYVNDMNVPYLIEAHIEKGVAISSAQQYVKDKKLRFMVLRPRADLPLLQHDAMLPQKAAKLAYDEAKKRHIPYDFKMNFHDSSAMFCSEVGSYAYNKKGIQLWQGVSTISSQGVVNWLQAFGVENFVTQMPSDLEYDPQLSIVAEWRNPETLYQDHIDNAVMDVLLEQADAGKQIGYNYWQLPVARVLKAWCMFENYLGKPAKIPEGMSATQALKNQYFVSMYDQVRKQTRLNSDEFVKQHGYKPPYWQLINLASNATSLIK
ncbi:MAG: hypothetical protein H7211_04700 [Aquabacterium sp.]|nr:hypothetical protein [Ferruginibacter sp.]